MRSFWSICLFSFAYLAVALLCLRQWGSANPWSKLNIYVVVSFLISVGMAIHVARLFRLLPKDRLLEFAGITFDPMTEKLGALLSLLEISIFLDYGHWQLIPQLQQPWLQAWGMGIFLCVAILWVWVDSFLVQHFSSDESQRSVIHRGPFQYLRHPRYTAVLLYKIAFALIFASILGWLYAFAWALILRRRILLEEEHLKKTFGQQYIQYSMTTWRMIPGLY